MEGIYNIQELQDMISWEKGLLLYFSSDSCSVCKVLKPKVAELLGKQQETFLQQSIVEVAHTDSGSKHGKLP